MQEQQLGTFLRSTYLDPSSESFINGIQSDVVNLTQIQVLADAGGEGATILSSVYGLLQGLFPPTTDNNITLANGTTVISPLGGYQYIPVESVEPNLDISLEGFTSCPVSHSVRAVILYLISVFCRTWMRTLHSSLTRAYSCGKLPSLSLSWKNYSRSCCRARQSISRTWYVNC